MLYGFLDREGPRISEATRLTFSNIDAQGALILDENKTNDPRAWALRPDVVRALKAWQKIRRAGSAALVFIDEAFEQISIPGRADAFRKHLKLAGVTRAALFERSAARRQILIHDLRATFVTINLALGRS